MSFVDFTDLALIVRKRWEAFKPCLGDKKTSEVYMERLEDFATLRREALRCAVESAQMREKLHCARGHCAPC